MAVTVEVVVPVAGVDTVRVPGCDHDVGERGGQGLCGLLVVGVDVAWVVGDQVLRTTTRSVMSW